MECHWKGRDHDEEGGKPVGLAHGRKHPIAYVLYPIVCINAEVFQNSVNCNYGSGDQENEQAGYERS